MKVGNATGGIDGDVPGAVSLTNELLILDSLVEPFSLPLLVVTKTPTRNAIRPNRNGPQNIAKKRSFLFGW